MTKAEERKATPVFRGFMNYFPNAIKEVAKNSLTANKQHNGDAPLHWDKDKSRDELDSMIRHLLDYASGEVCDDDGTLHMTKVAWRAMAALERYLTGELDMYEEYDDDIWEGNLDGMWGVVNVGEPCDMSTEEANDIIAEMAYSMPSENKEDFFLKYVADRELDMYLTSASGGILVSDGLDFYAEKVRFNKLTRANVGSIEIGGLTPSIIKSVGGMLFASDDKWLFTIINPELTANFPQRVTGVRIGNAQIQLCGDMTEAENIIIHNHQ